jgi:hypothetical protein
MYLIKWSGITLIPWCFVSPKKIEINRNPKEIPNGKIENV